MDSAVRDETRQPRTGKGKNGNQRWSGIHPLVLMLVVILVGLGFVGLSYVTGLEESGIKWELTKLAMQVSLVGVAGALFSFVAENYRRKLERHRFREDYLKDIMKRITTSYNKSKGARRIARGKGLTPSGAPMRVRLDEYDECVKAVNEAQLEMEAVKQDLKTSMGTFQEDGRLRDYAEAMERYLNRIVSEYEKVRSKPAAGAKELALSDVQQFNAFVAMKPKKDKADEITPFGDYADNHGDARDAINVKLLALSGATKR